MPPKLWAMAWHRPSPAWEKYKSAADATEFISYKLKPQLKTLGPKYGKKLGVISKFLAECDAKAVVDAVRGGGEYVLESDAEVVLKEEDLQIFTESKTGFVSASDKGVTVALNTTLTEELIDEGVERELVSKVQSLRKEANFEITDRIEVYYKAEGRAKAALEKGGFAADVLAVKVVRDVDEAIRHIGAHSTHHSDCIVSENGASIDRFIRAVDSAAVYVNASTRFTDGGEFGKGCEIGISTQKLHARGPMGLEELCSYKYIVTGNGQVR